MPVYTALTLGAWMLIFLYWTARSFGNKKTVKLENYSEQFLVMVLLAVSFVLLYDAQFFTQVMVIPQTTVLGVIGVVLAYAGAAFAIWARVFIGKNWSGAVVTLKKDHELIQTGPYAFVRHPIYTGFLAVALGTALTIGSLSAFIGFMFMLVAFLIRVPREESLMTQQFPAEYPNYKKKVKALIPFIL